MIRPPPKSTLFPYTPLSRPPPPLAGEGQGGGEPYDKSFADTPSPTLPRKRFIIWLDRKSTRLNSSHQIISYAVFCLKKKNNSCRRLLTENIRFCPDALPARL